jgi:hypothetical protein
VISPQIHTTFHRKRPWSQFISLAKGLFPLTHFRKQNDSILHSSPKQFFKILFNSWVYFVRKCRFKIIGCSSIMPNITILLCHFTKVKSEDSLDWPSCLIPLT